MKNLPIEPDFIGSQELLTKEEAAALAAYFAARKAQVHPAARCLSGKATSSKKATT